MGDSKWHSLVERVIFGDPGQLGSPTLEFGLTAFVASSSDLWYCMTLGGARVPFVWELLALYSFPGVPQCWVQNTQDIGALGAMSAEAGLL